MTITAGFIKKLLAIPGTDGNEGQEAITVILKMKGHEDFALDGNKLTAPDESKIDTTTLKDYIKNGDFNKLPDDTQEPGTDNPNIDDPNIDDPGIDDPGIDNPGIDEPTGPYTHRMKSSSSSQKKNRKLPSLKRTASRPSLI